MKTRFFSALKILLFFSIGVVLIWLVVRNLNEDQKEKILQAFKEADYRWVLVSILLGVLSNVSRAMRWKMLLAPLGHYPKLSNTFSAVMIGYLANLAVPRLGEVSRCSVLSKYDTIPFAQSFGTVITERIIDLLMLIILFFITLIIAYDRIYAYASNKIIDPLKNKLSQSDSLPYIFTVILIGVLFLVWVSRKKNDQPGILNKFVVIVKGFWEGAKSIRNIKNPVLFIGHSLFIWFMYYLTVYVCFYCFTETSILSASTALIVLVFGSVAVIVTPGGIGAYPIIVTEVLSLYSVSLPMGYAFGWIGWIAQAIQIIVVALLVLVLLPIINKK